MNNIESFGPGNQIPDPSHPEYVAAVVAKKPKGNDPKEIDIREKIRKEVEASDWAGASFEKIRRDQIEYLREMFAHILADDTSFIHARTQAFLHEIATELRAHIVEGEELLGRVPKGTNVLLMTNHLGLYKLSGINPQEELGVDIPGYDFMYPSPLYFGGLQPVAEKMGNHLSYVSDDFPAEFGTVHRKSGFVHVPPASKVTAGRTEILLNQTKAVLENNQGTTLVNFPEGGTSGKYSGLGPYSLDPFKTGGYVIAAELGLPVVIVGQYFHPQEGLQLRVFPPYTPEQTDKAGYEAYAKQDQERMQEWLDGKLSQ
jgi:hypothetical protein